MKFLIFILTIIFGFQYCTSIKQLEPRGIYYGVLPCADCPAIRYQLELGDNNTYVENIFYTNGDTSASTNTGHFQIIDDSIIVLDGNRPGMAKNQFLISRDTLKMLDINGENMESSFAEKYVLTKNKPPDFKMTVDTIIQVINFRASGNEPFWKLETDFENNIYFKALSIDNLELNMPVPDPVRPQNVNAVSYQVQNDSGALNLTIFRKPCVDDMSARKFGYTVTVDVKTNDKPEVQKYTGCGDYSGDYQLNDIWALESINGRPVDITNNKVPNIELQIKEQRVFGFSGCNRISGKLSVEENNHLIFSQLVSTKMACPDMHVENKFLSALAGNTFRYKIGENKLELTNNKSSLVFKKVD